MIFEDRVDAGQRLASILGGYKGADAIVLAIPRGGVVVGYEVAEALDLPLDVVVPRKLGAPQEPELAIGAVSAWGDHDWIVDEDTIRYLHVSREYIEQEVKYQLSEIERRLREYRGTSAPPNIGDKTAIIVDDGIATGYTILAASMALRRISSGKLIIAVPVASPDVLVRLSKHVDEIYAVETPTPLIAVGRWYEDFRQTTDEEVKELLRRRTAEVQHSKQRS